MPGDSKNKRVTGRLTSVQRNTTSEAQFISVQPPLEGTVLKAGEYKQGVPPNGLGRY